MYHRNSFSDDSVEPTLFFVFFGRLGGDAPEIVFLMILWNQLLFFVFLASWVGMCQK